MQGLLNQDYFIGFYCLHVALNSSRGLPLEKITARQGSKCRGHGPRGSVTGFVIWRSQAKILLLATR